MAHTPHTGAAAQNGADIDLVDAVLLELLRVLGHHHDVLGVQQLAGLGIDHIVDGITAADAVAEGIDHVAVLAYTAPTQMPLVVPQSCSRMMTS